MFGTEEASHNEAMNATQLSFLLISDIVRHTK
jgi:hypothetical protein